MAVSSEYTFPIFISSTVYNLKDLRAGLAEFLSDSGYHPILSSEAGFPDLTPKLEPWESCLPVLDSCFVVALIIDGSYSKALDWPNYQSIFKGRKVSPTHGEYLYSRATDKRIFIFIRRECLTHYQTYRQVMKSCNKDEVEAEKLISKMLPHIDFETLKFIHEIKTTNPIPWISEFDDLPQVQKGLQKKLVNQLAEIFILKDKYAQAAIYSLKEAINKMSKEDQIELLSEIPATKGFAEVVKQVDMLTEQLKKSESESAKDKNQIIQLKNKIKSIERKSQEPNSLPFYIKDNQIFTGNPVAYPTLATGYTGYQPVLNSAYTGFSVPPPSSILFDAMLPKPNNSSLYAKGPDSNSLAPYTNYGAYFFSRKCDGGCGKMVPDLGSAALIVSNEFKTCPECNRYLCNDCWPIFNSFQLFPNSSICPDCRKKVEQNAAQNH
jgi:hypothetical protein